MMDWFLWAKQLFNIPKPEHFNNYRHCCECAEHDETLRQFDVDSIGLEQLGYPSWDPLCGVSPEGLKYYLPAMVRLTLESMNHRKFFYADQLLFHLIQDGRRNAFFIACTPEQRTFVAHFIEYLIDTFPDAFDADFSGDQIIEAYAIWSEWIDIFRG